MDRTQDKIHARLEEIAAQGYLFEIYSDSKFAELLQSLRSRVAAILAEYIVSCALFCCSHQLIIDHPRRHTLDSPGAAGRGSKRKSLVGRSATGTSILPSLDWMVNQFLTCRTCLILGSRCLIIHLIRAPNSHLLQVETLHRSTFAFNCRVLETELHRSFKTSTNRLWANVGSGSYFLKDEDIKVRCRCFVRIYSHSCSRFKRTTRSSAACLLYMRRALQPLSWHSAADYRYLCVHMSTAPCALARWSATILTFFRANREQRTIKFD